MIYIGLTGWGDHMELYPRGTKPGDRLREYSRHFPIVEVDSSFYAIQAHRNYEKWVTDTPDDFSFIIKAYQSLTGHDRGGGAMPREEAFRAFLQSISPVVEARKLGAVLLQFPPWFDCRKEHVALLRDCKARMGDLPAALEFRHQSWFTDDMKDRTLRFMREEGWIHSVCDEPQAGLGSVPIVPVATDGEKTVVRFHGRNVEGWNSSGQSNWREVRYLYRYNEQELEEWVARLRQLERESRQVYVLFNNNSGGDAASNAKQMMDMLGIPHIGWPPEQLHLF